MALNDLDGLLNANPEFGDDDNIFGDKQPTSHIVDFNKYTNVPDTVPVDYSKLTQISATDQYNVVAIQETHITDDGDGNIKQSQNKQISDYKTYQQSTSFKPITTLSQSGEMDGIIIKTQFCLINTTLTLKLQITNENNHTLPISQLKLTFDTNSIGITSNITNINLPQTIKHKETHSFMIPLQLLESKSSISSTDDINNNVHFLVATNITCIKCELMIPIYLFFEENAHLTRDEFLSLWKSIKQKTEKRFTNKRNIKSSDISVIKSILNKAKIYHIHTKTIPNKGDIVYSSCRLNGIISIFEVSVARNGKMIIVTKSNNNYIQMLTFHAICSLLENKPQKVIIKDDMGYESKMNESNSKQSQIANNNLTEMLKIEREKNHKLEDEYKEIKRKYDEIKRKYDEEQRKLLKGREYLQWNVNDVINWLCSLDDKKYVKYESQLSITMKQENVNGAQIIYVDSTDLHRFGISDFGDKRAIQKHIKRLVNDNY